jgi:hypothetical protein
MIALSVLDQSPIADGSSATDSVRETVALAQAADTLGCRRYYADTAFLLFSHASAGVIFWLR